MLKEHFKLEDYIRTVPNFPKPGIMFKDLTPLLQDPSAFKNFINALASSVEHLTFDTIVAIEARGFLLGAPLAYALGKGLVIVRKPKKLPYKVHQMSYALEYGQDALEIHTDALTSQSSVLIIDDLLATGGTAQAAAQLVKKLQASIAGFAFLMELTDLKGRDKIQSENIISLIKERI